MHSRIFQVSKNKITKDNYIKDYRYEDDFVGRVADYVVESDNRKENIKWLTCHEGIEIERTDDDIMLKIVSKEKYFEKKL